MSKNCNAQQVCDSLLALLTFYKSQMAKIAEDHGLTIMQLHALRIINDGSNTMGTVAQVMHCDASNVTGIIDRLLSLKLVTRRESELDRRVKTVDLTPNGIAVLEHINNEMPGKLGLDNLQQKELNMVHATLQRLVAVE